MTKCYYVSGILSQLFCIILYEKGHTSPEEVGICDTPGSAGGVYVSGNYACVADGAGRLCILKLDIPANSVPAVSDIPDQTIEEGEVFSSIRLDDYVSDSDSQDLEITWTYIGNTKLNVSIDTKRVATIAVSEYRWTGSETITFTARDPGGLSASDSAMFTVTPLEFEPGDVNGDGIVRSDDAIIALRISGGLMEPTYYQKVAADMNGDGQVKANDAIMILRKAAGLASPDAGIGAWN